MTASKSTHLVWLIAGLILVGFVMRSPLSSVGPILPGIRDDLVALFATGDHIDRQAWEDLTHNDLEQARSVVDALDHIGWRCGDPTGTLRDVLDDWTAGLEAAEAAWQDDRRRDLAWAGKAWAE